METPSTLTDTLLATPEVQSLADVIDAHEGPVPEQVVDQLLRLCLQKIAVRLEAEEPLSGYERILVTDVSN